MKKLISMFPLNLTKDVFNSEEEAYKTFIPGALKALNTLSEREADILHKRYSDKLTLESIGDLYGVTKERVRQIEARAIQKLRKPSRIKLLRAVPLSVMIKRDEKLNRILKEYGLLEKELSPYINNLSKSNIMSFSLAATMQTPISELNFSTRTHHALIRENKNTLRDIANMTEKDLLSIRNLGQKSVEEIKLCLAKHGLKLKA